MALAEILKQAADRNASDIFIIAGLPLSFKINNSIERLDEARLAPEQTEVLVLGIYELAHRDASSMLARGDDDFSFSLVGVSRFRVSVYKQRGSLAAVIRVVAFSLPDPATIGIPEAVLDLSQRLKGMVLITGSAGSGKSTTLACIVDRINATRNLHVITLEDPLEYLHRHKKSIISQREIATDTESYVVALRAALRQSPDVICWARCAIMRPSTWRSPPRRRGIWCSPRCTPWAPPTPSTASSTCFLSTSRRRCGCSSPWCCRQWSPSS